MTRRWILTVLVGAVACRGSDRDGTDSARPVERRTVNDSLPPTASQPPAASDTLWLIAPAGASSEITARTTEAELIARFGAANVARGDIELGEGQTTPGSILFTGDSLRRLDIVWRDTIARARPQHGQVTGSRSRWVVAPGVSLGTSLKELERLNGRPFTLAGFNWDYGGTVTSWNNGRLDSLWTEVERVVVRLDPQQGKPERVSTAGVSGDRDFPSSHPTMQRLDPRAYQIIMIFK